MKLKGYEFKTELIGRPFREGQANGLIAVLEARGIEVPESARVRIQGATDLELLDIWTRRATKADKLEDVFGE